MNKLIGSSALIECEDEETCGEIISIKDEKVTVKLRDENGNEIQKTGKLLELVEDDLIV